MTLLPIALQYAEKGRLHVRPLDLKQANALVALWHRHHRPCTGHRFSIGVYTDDGICHGAAIVGRPVARHTDDERVAEVYRLVTDGTPNTCSCLYGACARACQAMGYERIQTFTLPKEGGGSLRGSGWMQDGQTSGDGKGWLSRDRSVDLFAIKNRWMKILNHWPRHSTGTTPQSETSIAATHSGVG